MLRSILLILFIFCLTDSFSQQWEVISDRLLESIGDTTYQDDVLNRNVGAIAVLPKSGYLLLVLNGRHSVYKSKDLGETWQPLDKVVTEGRSYGSFSINVDPLTGRAAIFQIVQKKGGPAKGYIINKKGKILTVIDKPGHDGWTWGMPAWEKKLPATIIGKEHHAWVKMWLSQDGGNKWQLLDFESRNPGVLNKNIFVAGNKDGIYRSEDAGKNWNKVASFIVTGKTPIKYADNFYWTTTEGLICTKDYGKNWVLVSGRLNDPLWGPFFGKEEEQMMVVCKDGFYISHTKGMDWQKVAAYFAPPNANQEGEYNVMHPTNSYGWDAKNNIIYAAGLGGQAYRLKLYR